MTLEDIKSIPVYQTRGIAHAIEQTPDLLYYVGECVNRMYKGDYGLIDKEDTDANNQKLEFGVGRILARYKAIDGMTDDIYIICYFDKNNRGNVDFENTTIMYCNEY